MNTSINFKSLPALALLLTATLAGCATTGSNEFPAVSDDGLQRETSKVLDAVYWKKGASLAQYHRIKIAPPQVEFRKNWQRDQNANRFGATNRVTAKDMDRIRAGVAASFTEQFTKELTEGGYQITNEEGDDVLLLKPSIINLDVNAPDVSMNQPTRVTTYASSAGEMTLSMELYDSMSNSLIGRVIDRRVDPDYRIYDITNSVTNRADANRIMRSWARTLREALDEAHKQ